MFAVIAPPILIVVRRDGLYNLRAVPCRDDGECECISEVENHRQNATDLPSKTHSLALVAFGPDEVEEVGCAEDECDENTGEDVV